MGFKQNLSHFWEEKTVERKREKKRKRKRRRREEEVKPKPKGMELHGSLKFLYEFPCLDGY